jgi:hypothetical protein
MADRVPVAQDDDPTAGVERESRFLQINPIHMGYKPDLNYDSIESLIEYGEGTAEDPSQFAVGFSA